MGIRDPQQGDGPTTLIQTHPDQERPSVEVVLLRPKVTLRLISRTD